MTSLLNVAAYSVQLAVLVAAAVFVTFALRLRAPRPSLYFWHAVFFAAILLPVLQPRIQRPAAGADEAQGFSEASAATVTLAQQDADLATLFIYGAATAAVSGLVIRLAWLAIGFVRLRRLLAASTATEALQPLTRELTSALNTRAAILLSDDVQTPATIGARRPLILLPRRILDMPERVQRAVIAHELVHVRRRDWLHTLFDELWCAVLWFHPAARVMASRLSLAREMVVDEVTLQFTRDRRAYAEALLAFSAPQRHLPGVTPLIRPRLLSQRISLIAQEDRMPRHRIVASLAFASFVCAAATVSAVGAVPFRAAVKMPAQDKVYKPGDGVSLPTVVREVKPSYTREAMDKKIQGSVFLAVVVRADGDVGAVRVIKSLDAEYGLDQAAVDAAKKWKFKPGMKDGKPVDVEVILELTFTLK